MNYRAIRPASITPQRRFSTHSTPKAPLPTALPLRRWHGCGRQISDLLDQKLALVDKLLVLGAVLQKVRQELQQLVPVHDQDLLHGYRLVGVGHKHLEHVETLVLYHLAVVAQQVHADLKMLAAVDVGRHDVVVGAVQQDLAEQFDRLALGDVAVRLDQHLVVPVEEEVEVDGQVTGDQLFVLGDEFLEGSVFARPTE